MGSYSDGSSEALLPTIASGGSVTSDSDSVVAEKQGPGLDSIHPLFNKVKISSRVGVSLLWLRSDSFYTY